MVCFCHEFPPGTACPECMEVLESEKIKEQLSALTTMVMPASGLLGGKIPLEKYISDFITSLKGFSTEIGHVMVVFDNTVQGNTIGIGNIAGVKDMNQCVGILKKYIEVLESGIPKLH